MGLSLLVLALDPRAAVRFASLEGVKTLLTHKAAGYSEASGGQAGVPGLFGRQALRLKRGRLACFPRSSNSGCSVRGTSASTIRCPTAITWALIEIEKRYRGHNLYLETLAETGILGLASFLAIILANMHGLWKIRKRLQYEGSEFSDAAMAFFLCLVAYLSSAIFAHLSYQRYLWLLMALCSATIHILGRVEQQTTSELGPA